MCLLNLLLTLWLKCPPPVDANIVSHKLPAKVAATPPDDHPHVKCPEHTNSSAVDAKPLPTMLADDGGNVCRDLLGSHMSVQGHQVHVLQVRVLQQRLVQLPDMGSVMFTAGHAWHGQRQVADLDSMHRSMWSCVIKHASQTLGVDLTNVSSLFNKCGVLHALDVQHHRPSVDVMLEMIVCVLQSWQREEAVCRPVCQHHRLGLAPMHCLQPACMVLTAVALRDMATDVERNGSTCTLLHIDVLLACKSTAAL